MHEYFTMIIMIVYTVMYIINQVVRMRVGVALVLHWVLRVLRHLKRGGGTLDSTLHRIQLNGEQCNGFNSM